MNSSGHVFARPPRQPIPGRAIPWLGLLLCAHAALQAGFKLSAGSPGQLLWFCHVGLALGGVGLLLRSRTLVTTSLLLSAPLHVIWLSDLAGWAALGVPPLGVVAYLRSADALAWLGTSYHLYTLPVLGVVAWRARVFDRHAMPAAMALSLLLLVASRGLTPRELNINRAFGIGVESIPLTRRPAGQRLPARAGVGLLGAGDRARVGHALGPPRRRRAQGHDDRSERARAAARATRVARSASTARGVNAMKRRGLPRGLSSTRQVASRHARFAITPALRSGSSAVPRRTRSFSASLCVAGSPTRSRFSCGSLSRSNRLSIRA